jgi:hypothetical protein
LGVEAQAVVIRHVASTTAQAPVRRGLGCAGRIAVLKGLFMGLIQAE